MGKFSVKFGLKSCMGCKKKGKVDEVYGPQDTVIVTGFEPFQHHNPNPSWEAVRLLPTTEIDKELNIRLITQEIKVSYDYVEMKLPQMWHTFKPLLVIHVGVSDGIERVTLEQQAFKSGYNLKDNRGRVPHTYQCPIGSSPVIQTALDLTQVLHYLEKRLLQTDLSTTKEHKTKYLCEYTYYVSLSIDKTRTVFIHVPPVDENNSALQLANHLAEIMRHLVQQVRHQPVGKVVPAMKQEDTPTCLYPEIPKQSDLSLLGEVATAALSGVEVSTASLLAGELATSVL